MARRPSGSAVNVRIGRPRTGDGLGEWLADTIGLADLGLPDLQIVLKERDPEVVMRALRGLVRTVFVGDRLECSWIEESALLPPERDAITLHPEL